MSTRTVTAVAPGKAILFGEHAINRGQPALAASVGLYARCRVTVTMERGFCLRSGTHVEHVSADAPAALARAVDAQLLAGDYHGIRRLAASDYFAPAKYVLALLVERSLPGGLEIAWESEIPGSSGLGSGGAAFVTMVAALSAFLPQAPTLEERAAWAHRGDLIAHGGVASALDTQTSLFGGVIRFTGRRLAEPVACAPGLNFVIGNTNVVAATSEVNSRVRHWLAERPRGRMAYFEAIGALSRAALPLLERGEWAELGRLFTLNQLILDKIGVGCPESDILIDAALEAGAWGAKVSGSGGGGIVIALVLPETSAAVAEAISAAGGTALTPQVGVAGVSTDA